MDVGACESTATIKREMWSDISIDFQEACKGLEVGELVFDSSRFGLFDAMSAIEIMDPKMDAGMLCKKNRRVLQFREAVAANSLKISNFNSEERIGIMDQLLACVVTWLDGHSLVQTLFTCLYLHDPMAVHDNIVKAYCLGILKLVDLLRNLVDRAKVFEEEDFQTASISNFLFIQDMTDAKLSGILKDAEDEITKQLKSISIEEGNIDQKVDVAHLKAMEVRLTFLRSMFLAFCAVEKPECCEIEKAKETFLLASSCLDEMTETISFGLCCDADPTDTDSILAIGFDPLVNQRLLPPSFPRHLTIHTREKALSYLKRLIDRLIHVSRVTQINNFHSILDFFCEFSRRIPCVLSRSLLQFLTWHNSRVFGKLDLPDMLRDTIKYFNQPPVLADMSPMAGFPVVKDISNAFLAKASRTMVALLKCYGHNRARQRERLGNLLRELDRLQEEADSADSELNTLLATADPKRQHLACFGSWVLYHTLSVLTQYLLLGFELELFSPNEFHYVYWYIDYLFGWSISCLSRAEWLITMQEQYIEKKCGKKDKRKKKELMASYQESRREHVASRSLYDGIKSMTTGIIKIYEGFEMEDRIKKPGSSFDNEQVRFEHRFLPFTFVDTPEPIPYTRYAAMKAANARQNMRSSDCFTSAKGYFERATAIFQQLAALDIEGAKLLKVAKTNFVISKLSASGHKRDSKLLPAWDFSVHQNFPLIKLR